MASIPSVAETGLTQVRRIAGWVRGLTVVAALFLVGFVIAQGLDDRVLANAIKRAPELSQHASPLTPGVRAAAVAALLPSVALALLALWQLWQLFGGYARGEIFTTAAAQRLRRLGIIVMAFCLVRPLTGALMSVAVTMNNPPGQRMLIVQLSSDDYFSLLLGAVLLAIASVMREAVRLAEENAEFI